MGTAIGTRIDSAELPSSRWFCGSQGSSFCLKSVQALPVLVSRLMGHVTLLQKMSVARTVRVFRCNVYTHMQGMDSAFQARHATSVSHPLVLLRARNAILGPRQTSAARTSWGGG